MIYSMKCHIHYQKKSPVFDIMKEARKAEFELQKWVQQVIQEAELGHTEPPLKLSDTTVTEAQKRPQRLSWQVVNIPSWMQRAFSVTKTPL